MPIETLRDVYRQQLGEIYDAEQQVLAVLDHVELETSVAELRDRVRALRSETLRQIGNVERCFELAGGATPRVESAIVRGIVDDRASFVGEQPSAGALEAYNLHLIGRLAALKRESYRQLCRLATGIRQDDARRLLEQNLHDEESLGFWIDENAASLIRPSTPAHGAQRH